MSPDVRRRKKTRALPWPVALLLALCLLFSGRSTTRAAAPIETFVSIPPHRQLVEQIGGPHVRVHVLIDKAQDPHTFEPSPRQITALSRARLYFLAGLPFENFVTGKLRDTAAPPLFIDTTAGVPRREIDAADEHEHPAAEEDRTDPHVWLAPPLLKIQADNILRGLVAADPAHADLFTRNHGQLIARLEQLHQRLQTILAPYRGRIFYVFHPAFGYFAATYGLIQKAIEASGKSPLPQQLTSLTRAARADRVRVIFVQPQFDRKSAAAMAGAIGGKVAEIDSLPADLFAGLEGIAAALTASMR